MIIVAKLKGHTSRITLVAFSPIEQILASGSLDKTVIIWDLNKIKAKKCLNHKGRVICLCFSPNGREIASGGTDAIIYIWNTKSWKIKNLL